MPYSENNSTFIKLIESWATTENTINSTDDILKWIARKNESVKVNIKKTKYDYTGGNWHYDKTFGGICNKTRTFFQIKGLQILNDKQEIKEQPIIIQNEIGYLGIIGKEINGILYFLMQAKIEPGNVNKIQISPTIQATKSNFTQVHGGGLPSYLNYFSNEKDYEIVVDQIQSEQSSRFLGKRNRNIIIIVDDEVEVLGSHMWMTLGQIKQLMHYDNLVNMDTRTVISCIPFSLRKISNKELIHLKKFFKEEAFFNSVFIGSPGNNINKIYQYINEIKMFDKTKVNLVDLYSLKKWKFNNIGEFYSDSGDFRIVYCSIEIEGREVQKWNQPLLEAEQTSFFGLMFNDDNGIRKYLIHAKSEVGCFDKVEIGPSVQLESRNKDTNTIDNLFLSNFSNNKGIVFSGLFSEEGGRFYHEQNRNIVMKINADELPEKLPAGYFWVDYQTLNILIQFNNCLNIQLRNLLSILDL